jgi:predicted GNAT superfamily acetyltransferase
MEMHLRPYQPADAAAVLALNQAALDAVTSLDADRLDRLVALAAQVSVIVDGDVVAGFAMVFAPDSSYDSANYAWFAARYDDFRYLDRVVVAPTHRRRGVGRTLYDHLEASAASSGRMALEVYVEPPNVASLAFHQARGYVEQGRLPQPGGKVCTMLVKQLG